MCHIPRTSTYRPESKLLKTDGLDEPYLEWVASMPGTMVQEYLTLNQNVPLGIETYYTPEQA